MTYLNVIGNKESRLAWREHLSATAINEDMHQDDQEQTRDWRAGFISGMANLIANATYLTEESTSELEHEAFYAMRDAREERERAYAQEEREVWVKDVSTGATDLSYADWRKTRGWD